ncbi:MAG: HAD-IC family P-type ATPase [Candidatus Dormibacteria bacterium]
MRLPDSLTSTVVRASTEVARAGFSIASTATDAAGVVSSPVIAATRSIARRAAAEMVPELELPTRPLQAVLVAWSNGRRVHLDLRPILGFPHSAAHVIAVEDVIRALPGVVAAHVETSLARLVVECEATLTVDELRDAVAAAVTGNRHPVTASVPVASPGDRLAVAAPLAAAVVDAVAAGAAVAGKVARLPAAPQAARAAVVVARHQPRAVAALEAQIGRVGADLLLTTASAAAHALAQAPAGPLLDLATRAGQISEARASRRAWARREPDLASPSRPQGPVVAARRGAGGTPRPRRGWAAAAAAAGEASHVVVDAAVDMAVDMAKGATPGPVEAYMEQAAGGSLVAAVGALLAGGTSRSISDSILAGEPKAAHLGREAFASVLGRGLAARDIVILDPGALRRLDRIEVVIIDGAALRGDARQVISSEGRARNWSPGRVHEVADALLHNERAPAPAHGELPADGARLQWIRHDATHAPAEGVQQARLMVRGRAVGHVSVAWELDPFAAPLLETARRAGVRVVLRHVAGTAELGGSVDHHESAGTGLLDVVRRMRDDRGPVLLISALHPDFASRDTLTALAVADVSVALDDPRGAAPWTADIITGGDLAAAVRVLSALPAARTASARAVLLAKAGTTLAGLLLVSGTGDDGAQKSLASQFSPVNGAGAAALVSGAVAARTVLRRPDPDPQPLTAWHALDPETVYGRLTRGAQPLVAEPLDSEWRRRLHELADWPVVETLLRPANIGTDLFHAARAELADPLTPVLAVGAAASAILGSSVDALLVGGVMGVNALIGGAQRVRAERATAELFADQELFARRVTVPPAATTERRLAVARSGTRTVTVPADRLRPGDVIDLRAPDVIPADARLLVADDLEVDESSLTGESLPVAKQVDPTPGSDVAERASMLFEGSIIVAGKARAIVVATGSVTAARRAIATVSDLGAAGGVQARLAELTRKAIPLTLAGGAMVTGLSMIRRLPLRNAVADGVALAVAAVPEGLPLVATLAQLASARRLTEQGVLVRSPRTLEALGRVDTVCFDKTGTLTENRLRVVSLAGATGPAVPPGDRSAARVLRAAARAAARPNQGHGHAHATDEAIITEAARRPDRSWTMVAELPFESTRGYAAAAGTTVRQPRRPVAPTTLIIKGAPEVVHERCSVVPPSADATVERMARDGLRVIAVAERRLPSGFGFTSATEAEQIEAAARDMALVGYVGLADTPRPSARPLIEQLRAAGISIALITGDHPVTAHAIARQLGMAPDIRVVSGAELSALDDAERAQLAASAQVFARVTPEQKVQVLAALRRAGRVCAMIGDGANDAAAIRLADVGVGITARGSSAARSAADIVLTGTDLTALLDALVEGRIMWGSVRDALSILLGGNAGEVAFTVGGTMVAGRSPVTTRQLLLVNLLTDMFPALAVAVTPRQELEITPREDEASAGEARRAHRQALLTRPVPSLDAPLVRAIVLRGAATAAGATIAWQIGRWTPGSEQRSSTMGLAALVGTQLAQTMLTRHRSPLVIATAAGSAVVLIGVVQTPGLSQFFGCRPLGPLAWTGVIGATAAATAASALAPAWLQRFAPSGEVRAALATAPSEGILG